MSTTREQRSPWARVPSFPAPERWPDRHAPGRLERLALSAQGPPRVDEELLGEFSAPDGRLRAAAATAAGLARLPLRVDPREVARLAARAPLGGLRILAGR